MKILLFGKSGQVGWELQRSLAPLGELVSLDRSDESPLCGDLENARSLEETVRQVHPNLIVNAAAYTAVDRAESEPDLARAVNAVAPGILAREAARADALLVHFSTDYVFSGAGSEPWTEENVTEPLNVYGHTKLEGEQLIRESGCRHAIFRTSWVYASRGRNFARTMLRLGAERDTVSVVDDQYGAPTGAELLADVTAQAVVRMNREPDIGGTFHVAAGGVTTWFGFAEHVFSVARRTGLPLRVSSGGIKPVKTAAFPTAATRPQNSRLSTERFRRVFGLVLPDWRIGVERMLAEILESELAARRAIDQGGRNEP